jgi:hypothetical protein
MKWQKNIYKIFFDLMCLIIMFYAVYLLVQVHEIYIVISDR